jgi:hypothetical protein
MLTRNIITHAPALSGKPSFELLIPSNLDLATLLKQKGKYDLLHSYAYICHAIISSYCDNAKRELGEYVPLYSKILYYFLTYKKAKGIISDLVAWQIIEVDNKYKVSTASKAGKCKGYRFCEKYSQSSPKALILHSKPMWKKLQQETDDKLCKQQFLLANDPTLAFLKRQLQRLNLDLAACYQQELSSLLTHWDTTVGASLPSRESSLLYASHTPALDDVSVELATAVLSSSPYISPSTVPYTTTPLLLPLLPSYVFSFKNYARLRRVDKLYLACEGEVDWEFTLDEKKTKRLFTNLTNLSRMFRRHLYLDTGERLVIVDVGECQPFLFSIMLLKKAKEIWQDALPWDVEHYVQLTRDRGFYRFIMEVCGVADQEREEFKKNIFAKIFYCGKWALQQEDNRLGKAFRTHFPNVYRILIEFLGKGEDNKRQLPIQLMQLESKIILGEVCHKIANGGDESFFIATIHDGIVTAESRADQVKRLIESAFWQQVGHIPTVKVDAFNYDAALQSA